ncbi:MAG: succinate dehydrogenase, cytochrome b556 subunit [Rhodospirillaceae bacterium]|jgi:succinate dehydrogenase / fumarate reductase, cytochrome b subunit|nr:succinate dehydrogenase, cytochrome b556 subunit [Rhodospirillaceae bacterium]MBT5243748.1 succinate dehydrogenase, cytochrome b556 subunit [Rhodospirillaceae bacterium]MBT5563845.1 succinate dehydrogenase, cytochrome b556 subunit [Rhodospirillaceae bacterium]MBT6241666.1 succinate dehydrogenase, cytochrome b556 subunit [Rhodospirillaceae bacterium]MBT7138156.1 succinate dehydrogenase, cytochrome b556 subunit [Rhodospirillaceae bacterium]
MTAEKSTPGVTRARPLSPHLQVYNPQITSVLSILHRMMGVALSFGSVFLIYWLSAAAYGPDAFARAQAFFGSPIGQLILLGLTFSLFYHLANGIRHLIWDVGLGFEMPMLRATGIVVVIIAFGLTALTWVVAYVRAGII